MSAQELQADSAVQAPQDSNAAAIAEVDAVLAELEGDGQDASLKTEKNGTTAAEGTVENGDDENDEHTGDGQVESEDRRHNDRRRNENHRGGRGGRGGGRGGFKRGNNIKSNVITEEKSSDPVAIRKQVEFYFSDSNLPDDAFLFSKVNGSENRPVELDIIRSFKRMRHFEPVEAIIEALKDSKTVELVDNDTKIQRKQPLPKFVDEWLLDPTKKRDPDHLKVFAEKAQPRTVYVKGFGEEAPSTQFDIEAWFSQFGPTNMVRLRRTQDDKTFKGSVFAEFETEELAKSFLELDPKPTYKERELKIMSKKEYCDSKVEDIRAGRVKPSGDRPFGKNRNNRDSRGRGGKFNDRRRDREDDRDWRTRREEDRKNGFRDDKRRDNKDRRGDRDRRRSDAEKDDRGIPVVKTEEKADREKARAEAIAQAKAAVEAEQQQEDVDKNKAVADATKDVSKKREREDDAEGVKEEPAPKKVDAKVDA